MDTFFAKIIAQRILDGSPKRNYCRRREIRERKWEELPIEDFSDSTVKIKRERGRTIWDFTSASNVSGNESVSGIEFPDEPVESVAVWITREYYYYPIKIDGEMFYMDNMNYIYDKRPGDLTDIPFMRYSNGRLINLD